MSNAKKLNPKSITLSIGIPTFNQAHFLAETLDSLLAQTRPPAQIIVSDHHSTDHTQQVLAEYAPRLSNLCEFKIVQPPPGSNLTAQYNFTLASQTAEWIAIFNSDDIAYPNYCEVLLRGAAAHPEAALVRSGWQQIGLRGKVESNHYMLGVPRVEAGPSSLTAQQHGPKVNGTAFALRRDAYRQAGPILGSMESLVDWALFLQVTPYGPFVYEHALVAGYRVGHDGNKFRDRLPSWTRDQRRIFTQVMPQAATSCGMKDLAWIDAASLYNFTRYLARASREFDSDAETRAPVTALFQPWADSLQADRQASAQALLRAFAAGAVTPTSIPLTRRLKNHLRPFYQRFHFLLRRSG